MQGQELESWLSARAAEALQIPVEQLDPARPLIDQGLDSLGAIELGQAVETVLGVVLPPGVLLEGASVRDLTPLAPSPIAPPPPGRGGNPHLPSSSHIRSGGSGFFIGCIRRARRITCRP